MKRHRQHRHAGRRARVTVEADGRFRYTWPCGHFRIEIPTLKIPGRGRVEMTPFQRKIFASNWSDGVQAGPCPTCGDQDPEIIDRAELRGR